MPTVDFDHIFYYDGKKSFTFTAPDLDEQIKKEMWGETSEIDPESYYEEPDEVIAINEFQIPDKLIASIQSDSEELAEQLRDQILTRTSKVHMAFDIASAQVEAVMRDNFHAEVTVDAEPLHLINCIGDIELLNTFLTHSELDDVTKEILRAQFIEKFVTQTCEVMEKSRKNAEKTSRFRAELENYKAIKESGEEGANTNRIGSVALNSSRRK